MKQIFGKKVNHRGQRAKAGRSFGLELPLLSRKLHSEIKSR